MAFTLSITSCNPTMIHDSRVDDISTDNGDENEKWWMNKTFTAADKEQNAYLRYFIVQEGSDTIQAAERILQKGQRLWFENVTEKSATLHMEGEEYDLNLINGNSIVSVPELHHDTRSTERCLIKTPSPLIEDIDIPLITDDENKDGFKIMRGNCMTKWGDTTVIVKIYQSAMGIYFYMNSASKFTKDYGWFSIWSSVKIGGDDYLSSPFAVEWNPSSWPDDVKITPTEFIQGILNIKCLEARLYGFSFVEPKYISLATLFQRYFSALTLRDFPMLNSTTLSEVFYDDGDNPEYYIDLSYFSPGILYYVMIGSNRIKFYINPQDLTDRVVRPFRHSYLESHNRDSISLYLPKDETYKLADLIRIVLSSIIINGRDIEYQFCEDTDKYGYQIMDLYCTDERASSETLRAIVDFIMCDSENAPNFQRILDKSMPYKNFKDDFLKIKDLLPELLEDTQSLKLGFRLYKNPYESWYIYEWSNRDKYPVLHLFDTLWGIPDSFDQ